MKKIGRLISALCFPFILSSNAEAHEPLFGIGPHTLYKNGIGIEATLNCDKKKIHKEIEVAYGITPDLTAKLGVSSDDFSFMTKYRFLRKDTKGASTGLAVFGKGELGDKLNYVAGLAFGYESRRYYSFADMAYTSHGFIYDGAVGIRPKKLEYNQLDIVLLVELNKRDQFNISPGILVSYRNIMTKIGIQIPIEKNGDKKILIGIEFHL